MSRNNLLFPGGRPFAFTVLDDTDVATVDNVAPIYDLLHDLGIRTTKTVWPLPHADPASNFAGSETLADTRYTDFIQRLQSRGFEITWHGATMESSRRDQTLAGLERFREIIGSYPRIHVNHAENRENLYWGLDRVDLRWIRWLLRHVHGMRANDFLGHVPGSEFWWGDVSRDHIEYCRNLTFSQLNLARINPGMPYRDPRRPLSRFWFSTSDAEDVAEFRTLLRPANVDRLEREGGFCIVSTHFGKGFVQNGMLDPDVSRSLESLAARGGWYPPVGELLDWLRRQQPGQEYLSHREWRRMQIQWVIDLLTRRLTGFARQSRRVGMVA